jgi:hypothetical protein
MIQHATDISHQFGALQSAHVGRQNRCTTPLFLYSHCGPVDVVARRATTRAQIKSIERAEEQPQLAYGCPGISGAAVQ